MKKIIDFLRKIGLLHISSGNNWTGEYDDLSDIKTPEGENKKIQIQDKNSFYSYEEKEHNFSKEKNTQKPKWVWGSIITLFLLSVLISWSVNNISLYLTLGVWIIFIFVLLRIAFTISVTIFLSFVLVILSFIFASFNLPEDADKNDIGILKNNSQTSSKTITVEAESSVGIWGKKKYSHIAETNRGGEKAKEAYLGDGGATLKYGIYIKEAGKYNLFFRLNDDGVHPSGTRNATIEVNGKKLHYKHNSENTKGWKWYKIGEVNLISGDNYINITKDKSTPAAFIIDKFKFVKAD